MKPSHRAREGREIADLKQLLEATSYLRSDHSAMVRRAYDLAVEAHRGEQRKSAESMLSHVTAVACTVAGLHLDHEAVAAALLHYAPAALLRAAPGAPESAYERISREVSLEVAELVRLGSQIRKLHLRNVEGTSIAEAREVIGLMARDMRIVIIRLVNRLHNLNTISALPEEHRLKIPQETLDLYVPIAARLGLWPLKTALEDAVLRIQNPDAFRYFRKAIDNYVRQLHPPPESLAEQLTAELAVYGITAEIRSRIKHVYGVWWNVQRRDKQERSFDEVRDLVGLRLIVEDEAACYGVIGLIHNMWSPLLAAGAYKDYIQHPKDNGYRSLHTVVTLPSGRLVEFQVRTREMDEVAEVGLANHWRYKEGIANELSPMERQLVLLRQMVDWHAEFVDARHLPPLATGPQVIAMVGDVVLVLPPGSTGVDLAYAVDGVGGHIASLIVNGKPAQLQAPLPELAIVEVKTEARHGPSPGWLPHVRTEKAETAIRSSLIERSQGDQPQASATERLTRPPRRRGRRPATTPPTTAAPWTDPQFMARFTAWLERRPEVVTPQTSPGVWPDACMRWVQDGCALFNVPPPDALVHLSWQRWEGIIPHYLPSGLTDGGVTRAPDRSFYERWRAFVEDSLSRVFIPRESTPASGTRARHLSTHLGTVTSPSQVAREPGRAP